MTSTAEQEVRRAFDDWFDEAAAKDLDAVMTHIADDVVSYEHNAPLQYVGAAGVRENCRRGFEIQPDQFRWDVPDLHIIVRDDIAVTWGLNRMRGEGPGQEPSESWSRGTRILQKNDGE
jgi:ketosteroid isomerase-like protein